MSDLVTIFSHPLDELRDQVLDLTPFATEERYRFIDCDAFLNDHTLTLYETQIPPMDPTSDFQLSYSTVSYVWFGLQATADELRRDGSFTVYCGKRSDGTLREDGGPISMKVLEYACQWSVREGVSLLWLDRLCILQTSRRDKAWQIERMYDIYASCDECIVLPGGLQRLASVYEETSWAERAWTYQEAIVTWEFATVLTRDWYRPTHWLVEGECHWQYLHQLFIEAGDQLRGDVPLKPGEAGDPSPARPCVILGRNEKALDTLGRIMEYRAYNALVEGSEETIKESTIRQVVLQGVAMRVSSRPIDMVLSILGLVGVQDAFDSRATEFKQNDRFAATLALAEAMLQLPPDDDLDGGSRSTMLDVPLWKSLEVTRRSSNSHPEAPGGDAAPKCDLPSLRELVKIFDDGSGPPAAEEPAEETHWRASPLLQWRYDIESTVEEPEEHAQAVARELLADDILRVHQGENVRIHHKSEGVIELCSSLEGSVKPVDSEELIFGWSLRFGANGYPYMRFFKFKVSEVLSRA